MCEDCKYRDADPDKGPCSHCIYWGDDGYRDYREFVNRYLDDLKCNK